MTIWEHLKNFFIPHVGNEHHPHIIREVSLSVIGIAAIILCISSFGNSLILTQTPQGAEVIASVLVDLTNADRLSTNKTSLTMNPLLAEAATLKAEDMVNTSYFAHTSPAGISPWHWFDVVGYHFRYAGENLAVNFADSSDVENAWMNSPSHRDNLLNSNFTDIGIAVKEGVYQGVKSLFVVELFGQPLSVAQAAAPSVLVDTSESPKTVQTPAKVAITPAVKGESTERTNIDSGIVAISETPTSIVVENTNNLSTNGAPVDAPPPVRYSTWLDQFRIHYANGIENIYIGIMSLLALILVATVVVQVKRHHTKKILYSLGVLCLLLVLFYINKSFIVFT